ncbi:MAG: hypothetical protein ACOZAO_02005 [Patescibacteria group bacterium]
MFKFFSLFFLVFPLVYAQEANYIQITALRNYPNLESSIDFEFSGNIQNYKVRPRVSSGSVSVYDSKNDKWVNSTEVWSNLPDINSIMSFKFTGNATKELHFELFNINNGLIYTSDTFKVKGATYQEHKVDHINNSLNENSTKLQVSKEKFELSETSVIKQSSISKLSLYYLLGSYLVSAVIGVIIKKLNIVIKLANAVPAYKKVVTFYIVNIRDFLLFHARG